MERDNTECSYDVHVVVLDWYINVHTTCTLYNMYIVHMYTYMYTLSFPGETGLTASDESEDFLGLRATSGWGVGVGVL